MAFSVLWKVSTSAPPVPADVARLAAKSAAVTARQPGGVRALRLLRPLCAVSASRHRRRWRCRSAWLPVEWRYLPARFRPGLRAGFLQRLPAGCRPAASASIPAPLRYPSARRGHRRYGTEPGDRRCRGPRDSAAKTPQVPCSSLQRLRTATDVSSSPGPACRSGWCSPVAGNSGRAASEILRRCG